LHPGRDCLESMEYNDEDGEGNDEDGEGNDDSKGDEGGLIG
jgi:hypothetical protein